MNTTGFDEEDRRKLAAFLTGLHKAKATDEEKVRKAIAYDKRNAYTKAAEPEFQQALDDVDFLRSCGIQP